MGDRAPRPIRALLTAVAMAVAGCGDGTSPPGAIPPPATREALVQAMADAYRTFDLDRFASLLAALPGAEFRFVPVEPAGSAGVWDLETEILAHRRMFRPADVRPGELPVPADLRPRGIRAEMWPQGPFAAATLPPALDPERWEAARAVYGVDLFIETQGETDYLVSRRAAFTVLDDRTKRPGEAGKLLLHMCEELAEARARGAALQGVMDVSWAGARLLYAEASPIRSEADFVAALADAYRRRDPAAYAALLSGAPGAEFRFIVDENRGLPYDWGLAEETRIHRRMFAPQDIPPGETPLDPELWLVHVALTLAPQQAWAERPQYYRSAANAGGLDAGRWRAQGAVYGHVVFFEMHGETDYLTDGLSDFVVAVDTWKPVGVPGRFLLYRWIDLGSRGAATSTDQTTWGAVKSLYL